MSQRLNITSSLSGELLVTLLVDKNHTIREVRKYLLSEKLIKTNDADYVDLILLYDNTVLEFYKTISECNIKEDDTMTFITNAYYDDYNEDIGDVVYVTIYWFDKSTNECFDNYLYDYITEYPSSFTIKQLKLKIMEDFLYSEYNFEFLTYHDYTMGSTYYKVYDYNDDEILGDVLFHYDESNKLYAVIVTIPNQNKLVDYHVPITKLYFF